MLDGRTYTSSATFTFVPGTLHEADPTLRYIVQVYPLAPDFTGFVHGTANTAFVSSSSMKVSTCSHDYGPAELDCPYPNASAGDAPITISFSVTLSSNASGVWAIELAANGAFGAMALAPRAMLHPVVPGSENDVDGDGNGDLVATTPAGALMFYRNVNADHTVVNCCAGDPPYVDALQIGAGWQGFTQLVSADINGDGYSDVIAVDPNGDLRRYLNSQNPTTPYGLGTQIGAGWTGYTHLTAADMDGDGYADLLAVAPDGTLREYHNRQDSAAPYGSSTQIGSGWQTFTQVMAANFNQDTYPDIMAITAAGALMVYENSGNSSAPFSAGTQIGSGWQGFLHVTATDISAFSNNPDGVMHSDGLYDLAAIAPNGTLFEYINLEGIQGHIYPPVVGYPPSVLPHYYDSGFPIGVGWQSLKQVF
jgi:hypothetical protein